MRELTTGDEQPLMMNAEEAAPEQGLSLRELLRVLRRRRMIALQTFILVVALGVILTLMTKPVYLSTGRVLVEGKQSLLNINNTTNPLSNLFMSSAGREVETQIEILRSPLVLDKAYKEAGIARGQVSADVRRVRDTEVLEITATSNSPEAAQKFASALPEIYLRDIRQDRMREVTNALQFAQRRLKEESAKLRRGELELEAFKQRAGIVDPVIEREQAITTSAQARAQLGEAEAQVSSLSAQLESLLATRRSLSDEIETPVTTTNTAQLQALGQRIDDLQSERARLLFLYKESDDEVRKVDLQIKELQARLREMPRNTTTTSRAPNPAVTQQEGKIADARAALSAAQANLRELRTRAAYTNKSLSRYNPIEREQMQLQRNLAASGNAVTSLTQSVEELSLRQKALEASNDPVRIIEAAGPATKIAPRTSRNLIMAVLMAVLLACGAALLIESLDDHLHDEESVRHLVNTPILGHFPLMKDHQPSLLALAAGLQSSQYESGALVDAAVPDPQTLARYPMHSDRHLLENFRMLRSNVQFTLANQPHRTLLVTSTMPAEGKSYTASNLAIAMALDGRRVVLIDSDLHRPRLHEAFDLPRQPGLSNVLVGQSQLDDCLRESGVPGMRLLTAGVLPPNPVELLNSPTMAALIETLKGKADVLIFDAPPLLATADAQVLASKVDGVLYVMQLGRVPRSAVQRSFELLRQARANVIGIVFNKISERIQSDGYYGYSYGSRYRYTPSGDSADGTVNSDAKERINLNGVNGHQGHTSAATDSRVISNQEEWKELEKELPR